jgi:hypothetical protein
LINPGLEKDLKEQLDKWITHDVIEPSSSPCSFAMVVAPKKGGAIHWVFLNNTPSLFVEQLFYSRGALTIDCSIK